VPSPTSLVVKNGSNARRAGRLVHALAGVGHDEMDLAGLRLRLRAVIVTVPPSGIASRALSTRFMITCSSSELRPSTARRSGAIRDVDGDPVADQLGQQRGGCAGPARRGRARPADRPRRGPNASSWRVRCAARSAAISIWATWPFGDWSAGSWRRSARQLLRIAISTLLKSCAIPPASWPIASNLLGPPQAAPRGGGGRARRRACTAPSRSRSGARGPARA